MVVLMHITMVQVVSIHQRLGSVAGLGARGGLPWEQGLAWPSHMFGHSIPSLQRFTPTSKIPCLHSAPSPPPSVRGDASILRGYDAGFDLTRVMTLRRDTLFPTYN